MRRPLSNSTFFANRLQIAFALSAIALVAISMTGCTRAPAIEIVAGSEGGSGNLDGEGNAARFDFPKQITLDDEGCLLVVEGNGTQLRRVSREGKVSTVAIQPIDLGGDKKYYPRPTAIAGGSEGSIIAVDGYSHVVFRIDRHGVATVIAGQVDEAGYLEGAGSDARLWIPMAIAHAPDGGIVARPARHEVTTHR